MSEKAKRYASLPNCSECGRFCIPADESTDFGSCGDLEPPDPHFYCKRCARKLERRAIIEKQLWWAWRPASWMRRVVKKLGAVVAGPKGAAWSQVFADPAKVPADYVRWDV
jgi:hypothetical protein